MSVTTFSGTKTSTTTTKTIGKKCWRKQNAILQNHVAQPRAFARINNPWFWGHSKYRLPCTSRSVCTRPIHVMPLVHVQTRNIFSSKSVQPRFTPIIFPQRLVQSYSNPFSFGEMGGPHVFHHSGQSVVVAINDPPSNLRICAGPLARFKQLTCMPSLRSSNFQPRT